MTVQICYNEHCYISFLYDSFIFSMQTSAMRIDLQGLFKLTPSQFVNDKKSSLENASKEIRIVL